MHIAHREVSASNPPLVVAEIGINHGGDLSVAMEMIRLAAATGCECVKHQTHFVDDEMTDEARMIFPPNADESIWGRHRAMRARTRRGNPAQAVRGKPRAHLHLHAVQPRGRGLPRRNRRAGLQDRLGRSGQPPAHPPRGRVRKAGHHVHRHADHRDASRVRRAPRLRRCRVRAAGVHQPLSVTARARVPEGDRRASRRHFRTRSSVSRTIQSARTWRSPRSHSAR